MSRPHLAEQAPQDERDSLRLTYEDLRTVSDDRALADRCLGSLLDFADRHDTRLLLIVENLNMLFSDMSDPDVGWQLRKTLQTEPRIILLGSATSRFDEIDNPEHALYDLFRVLTLRPLDTAECEALWRTVSGKPSVGGHGQASGDTHRRQPPIDRDHSPLRCRPLVRRSHETTCSTCR